MAGLAHHQDRRGGRRTLLGAVALLAGHLGVASAQQSCVALNEVVSRLNPGFWAPAFVFRSLEVRPGAIHPPNLTRAAKTVSFTGVCQPASFRADSFVWQRPTSDGGDWIATTASRPMSIEVDGVPCPLTGLAISTSGWPSLRLQFEECTRKTAVEVPLVNVSSNGLKLVHWLCTVTAGSHLCSQAANRIEADPKNWVVSQEYVDLGKVAGAASRGMTRMQIYNDCYENLDWFVINAPIGIDNDEFEMLLSLGSMLKTNFKSDVRIESSIVVETVCAADCSGEMVEKCHRRDYDKGTEAADTDVITDADADKEITMDEFVEEMSDPDMKPVALGLFGGLFVVGAVLSLCLMRTFMTPPPKPERRLKGLQVSYKDGETASSWFR